MKPKVEFHFDRKTKEEGSSQSPSHLNLPPFRPAKNGQCAEEVRGERERERERESKMLENGTGQRLNWRK